MKNDIKSMTLEEITAAVREMGEPAFRGKQIFSWLHRGVRSFEEMTNLSKPLREKLESAYYINTITVARKQQSRLDGTIKYLWELQDGAHAVPPRQHRVHLQPGGLPHGLRLLRLHPGGKGAGSASH